MSKVNDIFSEKIAAIIESMKNNKKQWVKMWNSPGLPRNIITNKRYQGFNSFILLSSMFDNGYKSHNFLTYKQAKELKGNIKKGEKGTTIFYFNLIDKKDKDGNIVKNDKGEKQKIFFLKYYTVFNLDQCEGIEETTPAVKFLNKDDRDLEIDNFIESLQIDIEHGKNQACYIPSEDRICMPDFKDFSDSDNYYATLFHEITHLTGSNKRLKRVDENYAFEELVAELGAVFLGIEFGLKIENCQHEAYLQSWVKMLEDNEKSMWKAASEAQKAFDFVFDEMAKKEVSKRA